MKCNKHRVKTLTYARVNDMPLLDFSFSNGSVICASHFDHPSRPHHWDRVLGQVAENLLFLTEDGDLEHSNGHRSHVKAKATQKRQLLWLGILYKLLEEKNDKSNLFGQLSERFGPSQVCKPVIDGTLRSCSDQPEIVLLIDLWLPFARIWKCVASQLFRNDAAEVWANLKSEWIRDSKFSTSLWTSGIALMV